MKKIFKGVSLILLVTVIILGFKLYKFVDRVTNGVEDYDLVRPEIQIEESIPAILVFTKTNGFIHTESIEASVPAISKMCDDNGWQLYHTKNGAIFNEEQLAQFDVVVWNNVSGPVLTDDQQQAMIAYIKSGGGFLGVHAAGDGSHKWQWYRKHIIGAEYSHHPMNPQFQEAVIKLECDSLTTFPCDDLEGSYNRLDEWYIFMNNPRDNGMKVLYTVDESTINPDGQIFFLQKDKKQGMGADHPIVWYNHIGAGRSVYSAMGHTKESWSEENHLEIIKESIIWTGKLNE